MPSFPRGRKRKSWVDSYYGPGRPWARSIARPRAKSNPDFISKIEGSLQELEESEYWLELLGESGFVPEEKLAGIKKETGELKGIFISIARNTKAKSKSPKP